MPLCIERGAEPIPGYKLIERLGGGGFGEVWRVEAPGGFPKAIKLVYGDIQTVDQDRTRTLQELKALDRVKAIRHPYILSIERYDLIEGRLLIVMELADRNLWDRFKECRAQGQAGIPRDELLRYMDETAEALDLMNQEHQLQHLDIKPQNLFLVYNHVKIADFGLVKDLQGRAAIITGGVTPVYAAPETFDGWVSRHSDQYSLSIVYQELLTGIRPFAAANVHQLIMQHVQGQPNLSALPEIDRGPVQRALAKKPDERFPSCSELIRALRLAGTGKTVLPTAGLEAPASPPKSYPISGPMPTSDEPPKTSTVRMRNPQATAAVPAAEPSRPIVSAIEGDGEVVPAIVLGLGHLGLVALKRLRHELDERFGSATALPHIRLLHLDTDPEASAAPEGASGIESLIARLNRASHFLRRRDSRAMIDDWFSTPMLYRIQPNQGAAGVRALGRLAFFDNYRPIVQRLRSELEAASSSEALKTSVEATGLKLRSSRPRIFIVSGLGGGSGSGMFIDVAYVLRVLLEDAGHPDAQVLGLLLLPSLDSEDKLSIANAYAALRELRHFSTQGIRFHALYSEQDVAFFESQPPFSHGWLIPASAGSDPMVGAELAGELVFENLASRLGRRADWYRSNPPASSPAERTGWSTFGMHRIQWPKSFVLDQAARELCREVVNRWIGAGGVSSEKVAATYVEERWKELELTPEYLIGWLKSAVERLLGQDPEAAFEALSKPLAATGELDHRAVTHCLAEIQKLVGHPSESAVLAGAGLLDNALRGQAEAIGRDWQVKLTEVATGVLENPAFRLAGTEQTIRALLERMQQIIGHYEPLYHELWRNAVDAFERAGQLAQSLGSGSRSAKKATAQGLLQQLERYPKLRYHALVLRCVIGTYSDLRDHLAQQLREVGFYRTRLRDLIAAVETDASLPALDSHCTWVLPPGCATLEDAVAYLCPRPSLTELEGYDGRIQKMIQAKYGSMTQVCTAPASSYRKLIDSMIAEMRLAIQEKRELARVSDMYVNRYPRDSDLEAELKRTFERARPAWSREAAAGDFTVISVPDRVGDESLGMILRRRFGSDALAETVGAEEIAFYREHPIAAWNEVQHLQAAGEKAYQHIAAAERFTPHARIDIKEWHPVNAS
jgi:serine/threonine protein kinase